MAVTAELIQDDIRYTVLKITNDGATDESGSKVTKLDASTLVGAPTNVKIKSIIADVMPTTGIVKLYFDGATDALAWMCNSHTDMKDFSTVGPLPNTATTPTGDISLQTNAANVTYTIIVTFVKGS